MRARALRRAGWAVAVLFFVNGAALGAWVSRIPTRQATLGMDEGMLGLALLGMSLGTVTTLPVAGGLVARAGARRVLGAGIGLVALGLPLAAYAAGVPWLFGALWVFGAGMSAMDVAMNAQGVAVETRLGRKVMVAFHGTWSLGGLVGTGAGAAAIALGASTSEHLLAAGILLGVSGLAAWQVSRPVETAIRDEPGPALAWPRGALWPLGFIALASALGEGAVADWSGVYLRDVAGAADATAPLGFLVFSVTMAVFRFAGDFLADRFGPRTVVRAGGMVAAGGLVLALVVPVVPVALVGFGLVGVGLAAVVPLSFSAAGRVPGVTEGEGVAAVATVAYSAFLAGPPVIGFVSRATSLPLALVLVVGGLATIVWTSRALPRR